MSHILGFNGLCVFVRLLWMSMVFLKLTMIFYKVIQFYEHTGISLSLILWWAKHQSHSRPEWILVVCSVCPTRDVWKMKTEWKKVRGRNALLSSATLLLEFHSFWVCETTLSQLHSNLSWCYNKVTWVKWSEFLESYSSTLKDALMLLHYATK